MRSDWPKRIQKPRKEHVIEDQYRDVIVQCRCGWRTAAPSLKVAKGGIQGPRSRQKGGPRVTMPAWVDEVMPYSGPCALCGGPDARHRVLDAMGERVAAGDSVESVAADYGYPVPFVERVASEWEYEDNEAEETPE